MKNKALGYLMSLQWERVSPQTHWCLTTCPTWWSPHLPNPHWPYQQLVYTDAIIYLPCSLSERIILLDSFSVRGRPPVGWMWWERARRRQFIRRLYYYLHLRKQTAWKQIEGAGRREGEWQMRDIDSYIKWIRLIKKASTAHILSASFKQRPGGRVYRR